MRTSDKTFLENRTRENEQLQYSLPVSKGWGKFSKNNDKVLDQNIYYLELIKFMENVLRYDKDERNVCMK